ncbi:MAG: hypothetical protein AAF569_00310 [Pseudomonadota bacterium]
MQSNAILGNSALFLQDIALLETTIKGIKQLKRRGYFSSGGRKVLKSDKRIALEQKVLAQMRETREAIDPEVLERFRDVIAQTQMIQEPKEPEINNDFEVIDKRKMYETILKFAKLRQDNQAFMNEVLAVLGTAPKQ